MLLAPALGAPPREIAERLGERLSARLGDAVDRVEVAGPGFLNVFLADAWYVAAARQIVAAGDDWGRGTPEQRRERQRRVRLGQPDRPADRRQRPPRRVRRRARAACSSSPATRSAASTTSTTPARRSTSSASRCALRARHEPVPEDGGTSRRLRGASSRQQIPGRRRAATPCELGAQGRRADHGGHPRDAARATGSSSTRTSSRARCTKATRRRSRSRSSGCASRGTCTSPRARCGCARPSSATTRTACSSARPARRRTSPPTSPTRRTSSCAASTARSTCSAPTTTATSRG